MKKLIIIIQSLFNHKGFCDECKKWLCRDMIVDDNLIQGKKIGICLQCRYKKGKQK